MFEAEAKNDDELIQQVSKVISWLVNQGLDGVEEQIAVASEWEGGHVGDFLIAVRPPSLTGWAYHQLALLLVNRQPMQTCDECGRSFISKDRRQRFCSATCGNRARQRRFVAQHAADKGREGK
jgi:hypothetical protein